MDVDSQVQVKVEPTEASALAALSLGRDPDADVLERVGQPAASLFAVRDGVRPGQEQCKGDPIGLR